MKKCPFCAEMIEDDAIRCPYCGQFLDQAAHKQPDESPSSWYFRKSIIVLVFLLVGPLALPLIWLRPRTPLSWKIGLTIAILVVSWILFRASTELLALLKGLYQLLRAT